MERTLKREFRLTEDETKEAVLEWMKRRDFPLGEKPFVEFIASGGDYGIDSCKITANEEAVIEPAPVP